MYEFTNEEWIVIKKVLHSDQVQLEIGAENWDLSEHEEEILWGIIATLKKRND